MTILFALKDVDLKSYNMSAYSLIVYTEGKHVRSKVCYTLEEHDEFMLMLLFDLSYPRRIYKNHVKF